MDPIVTAQYGMMAASRRFEDSARRMAASDADLVREAVEQATVRIAFQANAQVIRAADEMLRDTLDIVA